MSRDFLCVIMSCDFFMSINIQYGGDLWKGFPRGRQGAGSCSISLVAISCCERGCSLGVSDLKLTP